MADTDETRRGAREKRLVALSSLLAAVLLTGLKLVVGAATGSLGVLSEAAHSGLDLVAAGITFWAVRAAGRPPDREHAYGHGKFENLSALFETLLLLATCLWIVWEATQRLFFSARVHVDATVWAFAVMAVSIVVDFSRSRALRRAAEKYRSQALEADALHFSTDIWSSLVVLVGLGCVRAAHAFGLPWLAKADAVAALGVAGIVVWVSLQLGRRTIAGLLDTVPEGVREDVEEAARKVPGVLDVTQVRVRQSGPETFADVTLTVDRDAPFERTHDIASETEETIRRSVPGADVVVHVEPHLAEPPELLTAIRHIAGRLGVGTHSLRVYAEPDGARTVELHLEVAAALRLDEAHGLVSAFEEALRSAVPGIDRVVTHIEPAEDHRAAREATPEDAAPVLQVLAELERGGEYPCRAHDVAVLRVEGELTVSFHCTMDPGVPLTQAHVAAEQIEQILRARVPHLGRVLIHVEPTEQPGSEQGNPS